MNTTRLAKLTNYTLTVIFTMWVSACDRNDSADVDNPVTVQPIKESVFDFATQVGWTHGNCLAIKNTALDANQSVTLVTLSDPQSLVFAKINGITHSPSDCYALLADRAGINLDQGRVFYKLNLPEADTDFIAIGVLDTADRIRQVDNTIQADLDGDGKGDVFTSCDSSEGINFSIWKEHANQGEPVWTDYYYLGYDITPTCP